MKKTLTAVEAKSIKTPGLHRAGETLYLYVAPGGSKSWVQRLIIHDRRCDIGLGGFPLVSLAEARAAAFQNRCKSSKDLGQSALKVKRDIPIITA